MARWLQDSYGGFRIVVLGPCKSAGTLAAVGAGELAMGPFGELGPLDVQLAKPDEIAVRMSSLDTLGSLQLLQISAFSAFEDYMTTLVGRSGGAVSTKTACEIAASIVSGLFQPIASQIDPYRLAEAERSRRIALFYAWRLNPVNLSPDSETVLDRLIESYPSHGFIIDPREAGNMFKEVIAPSDSEMAVLDLFQERVLDVATDSDSYVCDVIDEIEASIERESPDEESKDSSTAE